MSQAEIGDVILPAKNGNGATPEERQIVPSGIPMDLITAAQGNVDVLEKLLAIWERRIDRDREIEANRALVELRKDIPQIERKGTLDTGKGKYKFAEMEDIDEVIRPHMNQHGFTFTFRTLEETDTYVLKEGMLIHQSTGWVFRDQRREPITVGHGQNRAQAGGAAQTYAMRYLKIAMLDLILKGEDTDGRTDTRERGPTTPPPSEKSVNNAFARHHFAIFMKGDRYRGDIIKDAFSAAENKADLEAFVDLIRDDVNNWDEAKQKDIGAALMKAREKLAEKPKVEFDYPVRDTMGETDGELFTDMLAWTKEFLEYWHVAKGADDRENLLHHNSDAIEVVMQHRAVLLKAIEEWKQDTKPDTAAPIFSGPVQPPKNNGKPVWSAWLRSLKDELATIETGMDLIAWVNEQKDTVSSADILHRQMAISAIAQACKAKKVTPPTWLRDVILPVTAACNHQEFAEARIAELCWIDDQAGFERLVRSARQRMIAMRQEDEPLFKRVDAAFAQKMAEI